MGTWPRDYWYQVQSRSKDSEKWQLVSELSKADEAEGIYRNLIVRDSYFKPEEAKLVKGVFDPTTGSFLSMEVLQYWSAK